jgi:hypothetical protein
VSERRNVLDVDPRARGAVGRGLVRSGMRDDRPSGPAAPLALDEVFADARARAREDRAALVRKVGATLIALATAIGLVGQTVRRERASTARAVRDVAAAPAR